tara:strand:- start:251 stop:487 length:237 start_codon:yes stop_codon:yes gene_type:complete
MKNDSIMKKLTVKPIVVLYLTHRPSDEKLMYELTESISVDYHVLVFFGCDAIKVEMLSVNGADSISLKELEKRILETE